MIEKDGLILDVPEDCPEEGTIYDGNYDCPVCGREFDDDSWDYEHGGDAFGGCAWYTCPSCEEQSVTVLY